MTTGIDASGHFDMIDSANPRAPLWFAGVRQEDRQVSLHLMPLCRDGRIAAQIPDILQPYRVDETRFVFGKTDFEMLAGIDRLLRLCAPN